MRENSLLSPHRVRQGKTKVHDGKIITLMPNVMWGTDGARVFTLDDGWLWVFSAVEHWNAECVGWHVCNVGYIPPVEFEQLYYKRQATQQSPTIAAGLN